MVEKKNILDVAQEAETMKVEAVQEKLETAYRALCKTREELAQELTKSMSDAYTEYEKSYREMISDKESSTTPLELEKQFVDSQFSARKILEEGYKKANEEYVQLLKSVFKETNLEDAELSSIAEVSRLIWSFSTIY